jgi:hypothetical protein
MYSHFNYIRRGRRPAKQQALATLIYNGCRPGKDREELQREYFGHGGTLTPEQAIRMIAEASPNTLFWRLILNPDPLIEDPDRDLNLQELTTEMVQWLERRIGRVGQIPFVAAEHDDHTRLRHIHALLLIERHGRERLITREVIEEFHKEAERRALARQGAQSQQALSLLQGGAERGEQHEPGGGQQEGGDAPGAPVRPQRHILLAATPQGRTGPLLTTELASTSTPCPSCGQGPLVRRPNSRVLECSVCGLLMRDGQTLRKGREMEWNL